MVDDSVYKVIGIGTVYVTGRNGTVHALEAVRYVPESRYYLIFIGVLDSEGCRIQMQHGVVTINQRDKVILKRENCGEITT